MSQTHIEPLVRDVLADPHWFLEDYHEDVRKLRFIRADRDILANQPFLAEGLWNYAAFPKTEIIESTVSGQLPQCAPPRLNFIWHTAFCCSTLIARALDKPGANLSLKEPGILLTLADARRQGAIGPGRPFTNRFPELVFRLLDRPFLPGEQVTVKPTNLGNSVIDDALRLTQGKHLFLFSDCRSFLISVAKKKEYGRRWARQLYTRIVNDGNFQARWPLGELFELTDLQIAAIAWHMEIAQFRRAAAQMATGRAVSLDCDAFLTDPTAILTRLDDFFGLGLGAEHLRGAVNGPLFARHSKDNASSYDAHARISDHAKIADHMQRDIDDTVAWSYRVCADTPPGIPLDDPMVRLNKAYTP